MARVTIDHMERSPKIGKLSITGTVDDEQAACVMMESELEGLTKVEQDIFKAQRLKDTHHARPPMPGKAYIEV